MAEAAGRRRGPLAVREFDTQTKTKWFPAGSAAKPAAKLLRRHGFDLISTPEHFLVEGKSGPMIDGEIERARAWGSSLVVSG